MTLPKVMGEQPDKFYLLSFQFQGKFCFVDLISNLHDTLQHTFPSFWALGFPSPSFFFFPLCPTVDYLTYCPRCSSGHSLAENRGFCENSGTYGMTLVVQISNFLVSRYFVD